jgi:biotin operon repressor
MSTHSLATASEFKQLVHYNILLAEPPKREAPDEAPIDAADTELFRERSAAIVAMLQASGEKMSAHDIAAHLGLKRPAISEFMRKMRERHMVNSRIQRHGAVSGCTFFYWAK